MTPLYNAVLNFPICVALLLYDAAVFDDLTPIPLPPTPPPSPPSPPPPPLPTGQVQIFALNASSLGSMTTVATEIFISTNVALTGMGLKHNACRSRASIGSTDGNALLTMFEIRCCYSTNK